MTTVLLTRHGQTEWNRDGRFRGRIDVPLNATGERQAAALAERLPHYPVSAIYTGPMQRTRRTGEICAARLGLTIQVSPGLLDADYGDWQGRSISEISERYPDLWRLYLSAPHEVHFPGGEDLPTMQQRAVTALEELITRHPDETILLVGHQGLNRALLCAVLGVELDHYWLLQQDTCCLNIFKTAGDRRYEIVTLNDTCHMEALANG